MPDHRRPALPLRLTPVNDIVVAGEGFRSTGSDPFFLLDAGAAGFPQGRCEFVFEALSGVVPLQPVLYLDTGADFNEAQTIRLEGGEAGIYRQLVNLPPGLRRLRFDPAGLAGPLPLRDARLIPLPGAPEPGDARDYTAWVRQYDTVSPEDRRDIARHIRTLPRAPRIVVWVDPADADAAAFNRTAESLHAQLYTRWLGRLPPGCSVGWRHRWRWRRDPAGAFALLLRSGDLLAPSALYLLALELAAHTNAAVLTFDEDHLVDGARTAPRCCGAWSPDLLRAGATPGAVLARQETIAACGGLSPGGLRELLLRLSDSVPRDAIRHVPGVLLHRGAEPVYAEPLRCSLPAEPPLASIIVPTRDAAALLQRTLDGVLHRTAYPRIEVIVLDNGSTDPAALATLASLARDERVRVLPAPGPFNYSALNNEGVAAARGEVVVLLNNDMDVIEPGWLSELVAHAMRPDVGAVGCKLLYADGTVQHAGIVTGMTGLAGHVFRGQPADAPGLALTRNVSAVTAACLAMRRSVYLSCGGMDAVALAVSYSDVDLCLRLREAGLLIVWTPFACLLHLESVSRGADANPENRARALREHDALLRRWGARLLRDPFYSPCLSIDDESGGLAWPPRTPRPWRTG